ncbi:MAG TPA: YqhA family protein [Nocardioides sp.]
MFSVITDPSRQPNQVGVSGHLHRVPDTPRFNTILAGVVLLQVGLGLWELCVGDLALPESLATHTFDELEAKVPGTLVLVLVVRFLEELVQDPEPQQLLATGIAVTLVGGLLVLVMRWRH